MKMAMRMELFVEDIAATVEFYTRVLGFEQSGDEDDRYMCVENGYVMFGIAKYLNLPADHHFDQASIAQRRGLGVEVVLEVDDLDAFYQQVVESGYPIREPLVTRPWGSRDFRVVDPDGYYLRITNSQVVNNRVNKYLHA